MLEKLKNDVGQIRLVFILKKAIAKLEFELADTKTLRMARFLMISNKRLFDKGLVLSAKKSVPLLRDGTPIPWVTHPFLEYISKLNLKKFTMVEFGSGNSTIFFSKKVKQLISHEHDLGFINYLREVHEYKGEIRHVDHRYGGVSSDFDTDIVFIDGLDRNELLRTLLHHMTQQTPLKQQLVIIDNPDYLGPKLLGELSERGFFRIDFYGTSSGSFVESITSLFISRDAESVIFQSLVDEGFKSLFASD